MEKKNKIATTTKTFTIDMDIFDFLNNSGIIKARSQSKFIMGLIRDSKKFKDWRKK